jgi:hypothetical protein
MMILPTEAQEALDQDTVPMISLLRLGFAVPTGLNSSNVSLSHGGVLYRGAYGLGSISPIEDGAGEVKGLQFELFAGGVDIVALALDDAKVWQGTPVEVMTAILNSAYEVVHVQTIWTGKGDTMAISEQKDSCILNASAESSAVDLLRGHASVYADVDQRAKFPNDAGLSLILSQIDRPVIWPAKEFFFK